MSPSRIQLAALMALLMGAAAAPDARAATVDPQGFATVNRHVQQRCVKIYGAGGLRQLEAYQSGMLVSAEGHVATVASLVLNQDEATVHLDDGRRYRAAVVGVDPVAEVAVLKLEAEGDEFPHFDLAHTPEPFVGMRVRAFSNLFNIATGEEPVSVLNGVVASIAPLEARRGAFATRYRGEVYILDASTNNPGAAGGVLVDLDGQPLGMLGKEVRSEQTGAWLHYALPLPQVARSVDRILSGEGSEQPLAEEKLPEHPATFNSLGVVLVPNVVPRTPPYVDKVAADSPAAAAGLRPDDLLVAVAGQTTGSRGEVELALQRIAMNQPLALTILRDGQLLEIELAPADEEDER